MKQGPNSECFYDSLLNLAALLRNFFTLGIRPIKRDIFQGYFFCHHVELVTDVLLFRLLAFFKICIFRQNNDLFALFIRALVFHLIFFNRGYC